MTTLLRRVFRKKGAAPQRDPKTLGNTMFSMSRAEKQQHKDKYDRIHVVKGDPVAGQLADMIAGPPEGSIKTQITPKLADEMLKYNTNNRPLSAGIIAHYANQMVKGEWQYTRVPIIFSDAGRLIDGQHRLNACVAANVPILADVSFGAPDDAFAYIDTGKKRGGSDIFAINGVPWYRNAAAVTCIVLQYYSARTLSEGGGKTVTPAELYEFYTENQDIQESKNVYRAFAKNRLANPALMAGVYTLCARKCRRDADHFFAIAADGFGAEKRNDPALVLHKKLIEAATSGDNLGRKQTYALTVNAWNKMRDGLSGHGLKYDPEAKPPRLR